MAPPAAALPLQQSGEVRAQPRARAAHQQGLAHVAGARVDDQHGDLAARERVELRLYQLRDAGGVLAGPVRLNVEPGHEGARGRRGVAGVVGDGGVAAIIDLHVILQGWGSLPPQARQHD